MEDVEKIINVKSFYIANQNTSAFDEIQRMLIAYTNGQPVALEGIPGVGKNAAISVVAEIAGKDPYRIRCTEEMMARDIIGGEKLAAERSDTGSLATKTVFAPGKLMKAMQEGNIVILDEANQLTSTVQKALNSVLEETKTLGDLDGNMDVQVKKGFGLFITYNPETGVATDDLEIAVKDRCKLLYFEDIPGELKARIALLRTGQFTTKDMLDNAMGVRGIYPEKGNYRFAELKEGEWKKFKRDEPVTGKVKGYLYFDRNNGAVLEFSDDTKHEYYQIARAIVNTFDDIAYLKREGTRGSREKFGVRLDDVGRLNLNLPSPRITMKLLDDYLALRGHGYKTGEIMTDIARSIIDFTVPASERSIAIGDGIKVPNLVERVCQAHGLMSESMITEMRSKARGYSRESLTRELMQKGLSERMAKGLVEEYAA